MQGTFGNPIRNFSDSGQDTGDTCGSGFKGIHT